MIRKADDRPHSQHLFDGVLGPLAAPLIDDVKDFVKVPADGLLLFPARQFFRHRVYEDYPAGPVRRNDTVADGAQGHGQTLLFIGKGLPGETALRYVLVRHDVITILKAHGDEIDEFCRPVPAHYRKCPRHLFACGLHAVILSPGIDDHGADGLIGVGSLEPCPAVRYVGECISEDVGEFRVEIKEPAGLVEHGHAEGPCSIGSGIYDVLL